MSGLIELIRLIGAGAGVMRMSKNNGRSGHRVICGVGKRGGHSGAPCGGQNLSVRGDGIAGLGRAVSPPIKSNEHLDGWAATQVEGGE